MKDIYIHYGSTHFRPEVFKAPRNQHWVKPIGGLWACLKNDERAYTWKDWNESENFADCCEDNSFSFTLKDDAHIHYVYRVDDLIKLPLGMNCQSVNDSYNQYWIDFEKCIDIGIDAIEIRNFGSGWPATKDRTWLRWALYGWDCDCILILNPACIEKEW